jgi:hypothetical protein
MKAVTTISFIRRYGAVVLFLAIFITSCKKDDDISGDDYTGFRTVGLLLNNTSKVYNGYTLFAPKQNTMTYLINNEGRIIHQWNASKYPPGQSVYLLENGHLLRSCMTPGKLSSGGGEGGRVEEYDWDGNLVWELDFSTDTYMQHHDIHILPNGNILMLVIEKKTYAECIAAGFNPNKFQPEIA